MNFVVEHFLHKFLRNDTVLNQTFRNENKLQGDFIMKKLRISLAEHSNLLFWSNE